MGRSVRNFYTYLNDKKLSEDKERIATLMVERGVDPYLHIEHFLQDQDEQLLAEWLGGFFKRIGNAWNGFMSNPNPKDSPMTRLETARKALNDLHHMVATNKGADPGNLNTIVRGLEQTLTIVDKVKPALQQYDDAIPEFEKTGVPHSDPSNGLPKEWHDKWADVLNRHHQTIAEPNSEEKKNKLVAIGEEIEAFYEQLRKHFQTLNPRDPAQTDNVQRIQKFLQSVDTDTQFRDIRDLLDYAKKRTSGGLAAKRPDGHEQVEAVWRQLSARTPDMKQRGQQLIQWYQKLPDNHPVKAFIKQDMEEHPENGNNEVNVFWKYAVEWINKHPHH